MPGSGLCLPPYFMMDDRVRMLTAHELKAWLAFSLLAARNRREPGVIPAMAPEMRAKKLGMPPKVCEKRLERLTTPGIELVQVRADGALVIADLWDDEEDDPDGGQGGPYDGGSVARTRGALRTQRWRERKYGHGSQNGHGHSGNGSNGISDAQASQMASKASQMASKASQSSAQASHNGHGSVTAGVTKRVTGPAQNGYSEASQQASLPRARVGSNSNLESGEREYLNSSSSGFEFERAENVTTQSVTENVTPNPAQNVTTKSGTAAGGTSGVALAAPRSAPPRPEPPTLAAEVMKVKRAEAVRAVMQLTGDSPANRNQWVNYWTICHDTANLGAWNEALRRLTTELGKQDREAIANRASWLVTTLRGLLEDEQVFIPTKAEMAENPPDEVRRLMHESMAATEQDAGEPPAVGTGEDVPALARASLLTAEMRDAELRDAEQGNTPPAVSPKRPTGGITPLGAIYTEEAI